MARHSRLAIAFLLFVLAETSSLSAQRMVDLKAPDGTALKATFFAAAKPGPGVLLLHQCNRQRKVWDGLAQQLAAAGINVMTMDLRGFGESGDERYDKLPPQQMGREVNKWPGDIDVAFQYLVSQPGVERDRIGVGGASCGVNNAVQVAIRHPEVKSLVLMSGPTDLKGRQYLRKSGTPVFFAVADDDEFHDSIMTIEWLYSATGNPGKVLEHYTKGGHGSDMFAANPDLPSKIVDWYVTTLIKTPGQAPVSKDKPEIPQQVKMLAMIDEPGGAAKASDMLAKSKGKSDAAPFDEAIVNLMGYERMQAGDNQEAVAILKLNAQVFPDSPNVWDSLSDAYLASGDKEQARLNARKAIELLATDKKDDPQRQALIRQSALGKLKQLGDIGP